MFKVIMNKEKLIELANIKNTQNPKEEEKKIKTEKETKIGQPIQLSSLYSLLIYFFFLTIYIDFLFFFNLNIDLYFLTSFFFYLLYLRYLR